MVAARLQEQHGMFRLFGCSAVRLFGCSAAQLFSCSAARRNRWGGRGTGRRLRRCRLHSGGSVRNRVPTRFSDQLFGPAFRTSFPGLLRDWLSDLLFGPASGSASRSAFGFVSGPAFRTCFRVCFPDAGAILFDCGMRSVVPIRPQDSFAQFLPQQLPAAGV